MPAIAKAYLDHTGPQNRVAGSEKNENDGHRIAGGCEVNGDFASLGARSALRSVRQTLGAITLAKWPICAEKLRQNEIISVHLFDFGPIYP